MRSARLSCHPGKAGWIHYPPDPSQSSGPVFVAREPTLPFYFITDRNHDQNSGASSRHTGPGIQLLTAISAAVVGVIISLALFHYETSAIKLIIACALTGVVVSYL